MDKVSTLLFLLKAITLGFPISEHMMSTSGVSSSSSSSVALLLHSSPGIFLVCLLLVLRVIVSGFLPQSKYVQINWWLSSVCRYK